MSDQDIPGSPGRASQRVSQRTSQSVSQRSASPVPKRNYARRRVGARGHLVAAEAKEPVEEAPRSQSKGNNPGYLVDEQGRVWSPPPPRHLKTLTSGRIFGFKDFRYGVCIGKGSIASVRMVVMKTMEAAQSLPLALKVMHKHDIVHMKLVDAIKREKMILEECDSPYVINFLASLQDERRVGLLLEYVHGGDLCGRLRHEGRLPVDHAKFYTCELILALKYLHVCLVMYRDLKPDNILITATGHLKLADFGFAKRLKETEYTKTICGSPEYMSPEVIKSEGHNHSTDFWSLGVVIFEMLVGYPPFFDTCPYNIYKKILHYEIKFPRHFDVKAKDLVHNGLLNVDKSRRFNAIDCMLHVWFDFVDWPDVIDFSESPPFRPRLNDQMDTRHFELVPDAEARDQYQDALPIKKSENMSLADFF